MSSSEMPFFAAALLYSDRLPKNPEESRWFSEIQRVIKSDSILKRSIRLIKVDNLFSRDLLTHNTSGVKVSHCPVFAIKYLAKTKPTLYRIDRVNEVFSEVYQAYYAMFAQRQVTPTRPPQINLHGPISRSSSCSSSCSSELEESAQSSFNWTDYPDQSTRSPDSSDASDSPDIDQTNPSDRSEHNKHNKHNKQIYQQKKGSVESIPDDPKIYSDQSFPKISEDGSTQVIISWNLDSFHPDGQGRQIWVQPGDHLTIRSNDSFHHSIILTDAYWKMIQRQIHPTSHNVNIIIPIKFQPGHYYLMDGCYPDRIRLKMTVQSPSETVPQIFNLGRDRIGTTMELHPNIYTFKTKPCHRSELEPVIERSSQPVTRSSSQALKRSERGSFLKRSEKEDYLEEFDLSEGYSDSDWSPETNEF